MEQSKKTLSTLLSAALFIIFVCYAAVLLKIILFKYGLGAGMRSWNFVPFRFVLALLHPETSIDVALKNVLGNFAIFIPLGVLTPVLFRRFDAWWKPTLLGLCVSALFELLQGVFGLGATDVDDLLLNTLGAAAGSAVYFGVLKRCKSEWKRRLAALGFLCAFGLAGLLSLWLYAPGELPSVVEHRNAEALDGLDRASYTVTCVASGLSEDGLLCRVPEAAPDASAMAVASAYTFADDVRLYQETLSYQYSPNGNVQKTICTYAAIDRDAAQALFSQYAHVFADLWLNAAGECTTVIFTVHVD